MTEHTMVTAAIADFVLANNSDSGEYDNGGDIHSYPFGNSKRGSTMTRGIASNATSGSTFLGHSSKGVVK